VCVAVPCSIPPAASCADDDPSLAPYIPGCTDSRRWLDTPCIIVVVVLQIHICGVVLILVALFREGCREHI
jgi:hypothetical protein